MKLEPGALLGNGKYQLTRHLGEGSQADVWGARQLGLAGFSKDVVLKCMDVGAVGPTHQQLMLREARLAASLRHPNVIEIYDVDEDEDLLYIAMEHIHGTDLEIILQHSMTNHERPIPWALATAIGIEVCKGLYYAHAQAKQDDNLLHLVHRDLKPGNILLSQQGYVKVIDFGIAKAMHPKVRKDATHAGKIKGTPAYMSPEQIMEKPIDARSDLYSLGTILFELYTGRRPFQSDELFTMLIQVVQEDAPTPRSLRPDLPEEIDGIVNKLLAKKPEQRFQNARALRRALESILRNKQLFIETEDLSAFYQSLQLEETSLAPSADLVMDETVGDDHPEAQRAPQASQTSHESLQSTSGISYNVVELGSPGAEVTATSPEEAQVSDDELLPTEEPSFSRVALDTSSPSQELNTSGTVANALAPSLDLLEEDTAQAPASEEISTPAPEALPATPEKVEEADTQQLAPPPPAMKEEETPTSSLMGLDPDSLLSGGGDLFALDDLDSIFASLEQPDEETATSSAASMLPNLTPSSPSLPSTSEDTAAEEETRATQSTEGVESAAASSTQDDDGEAHEPAATDPIYEPPSLREAALAEEASAALPKEEEATSDTSKTEGLSPETPAPTETIEPPADSTGEALPGQAAQTPVDGLLGTTLEAPQTTGQQLEAEKESPTTLELGAEGSDAQQGGQTEENPAHIAQAPQTTPVPSISPDEAETSTPYTGGTALMASFSALPPQANEAPREPIALTPPPSPAATAAYPSFHEAPTTQGTPEAPQEAVDAPEKDEAETQKTGPYDGFESSSETSLDASPFASLKPGDPIPDMPPVATAKTPTLTAPPADTAKTPAIVVTAPATTKAPAVNVQTPAATAQTTEAPAEPATPPQPNYDMSALDDILGFDDGDRTITSPSPQELQPGALQSLPTTPGTEQRISLGIGHDANAMGSTIEDGISVGQIMDAANKRTMDEPLSVEEILNEHQRQGVAVNRTNPVPATVAEMAAMPPSAEDDLFSLDEGEKTALNPQNGGHDIAIIASSSSSVPRTKKANIWLWGMVLLSALAIIAGLFFYLRAS